MRTIRIFFSSPSDVRDERELAREVVQRVARRFSHHCNVESLFWESEPLRATATFPEEIPNPAVYDIVVVLLWSRLGTNLPDRPEYRDEDGNRLTGTEWEYFQAREEFINSEGERPALLVYRKRTPVRVSLEDETGLQEAIEQKNQLERFWAQWFMGGDGSITGASHDFDDQAEFEEILEQHLRSLVRQILEKHSVDSSEVTEDAWGIAERGAPFRGLSTFEVADAPILFGRTKARFELRELLRDRIANNQAAILVVGASGSGKSSLVKAGLISDLKKRDAIRRVSVCRHAVMRPSDADEDLITALVDALIDTDALPELLSDTTSRDSLRSFGATESKRLVREISEALQLALEVEGQQAPAEARLVLMIDQMEELFTLGRAEVSEFAAILDVLARSGVVWVVATMRSDFFHCLDEAPRLKALFKAGLYNLDVPTREEMAQIIRKPAELAGLTFEQDPETGATLAAELEKEAADNPHALPLLEFVLELLFRSRDSGNVLRFEDYHRFGGLSGAIAKYADEVIGDLDKVTLRELDPFLRGLVTISSENRAATAVWADRQRLTGNPHREQIAHALEDARLLVSKGGKFGVRIRVAHEELIRSWGRLESVVKANRKFLLLRSELDALAANYAKDSEASFLLWGRRLAEARRLLEERHDDLDAPTIKLIEKSIEANEARERREERLAIERVETAERLAEQQRKIAGRTRFALVATVALAVVALGGFGVSLSFFLDRQQSLNVLKERADLYDGLSEVDSKIKELWNANRALPEILNETSERLAILETKLSKTNISLNGKIIITEAIATRRTVLVTEWRKTSDDRHLFENIDEAVRLYTQIDEKSLATPTKHHFASELSELAETFHDDKKLDEAIKLYERAIEIRKHVLKIDPKNAECKCQIARLYKEIAAIHQSRESYAQAREVLLKRLEMARELVADSPEKSKWRELQAYALMQLANLPQEEIGKERDTYFNEGMSIWRNLLKQKEKTEQASTTFVGWMAVLAETYRKEGRMEDAFALLEEATTVATTVDIDRDLLNSYLSPQFEELAWQFVDQKKTSRARTVVEKAISSELGAAQTYLLTAHLRQIEDDHDGARALYDFVFDVYKGSEDLLLEIIETDFARLHELGHRVELVWTDSSSTSPITADELLKLQGSDPPAPTPIQTEKPSTEMTTSPGLASEDRSPEDLIKSVW